MISDIFLRHFVNAARALATGAKDTGFTSNGLRKLDFVIKGEDNKPRVFTALQQNPNKLSVPGKMAREGHVIVQIRDNDAGALVGNVDVDHNRFNSYENIPQPVGMEDIEQALGSNAVSEVGQVAVTASRTATPVNADDLAGFANGGRDGGRQSPFTPGREERTAQMPPVNQTGQENRGGSPGGDVFRGAAIDRPSENRVWEPQGTPPRSGGQDVNRGQDQGGDQPRSPQGPEFENRPGRASFEGDTGKKVA